MHMPNNDTLIRVWAKILTITAMLRRCETCPCFVPGKGYDLKAAEWRTKPEEMPKSQNAEIAPASLFSLLGTRNWPFGLHDLRRQCPKSLNLQFHRVPRFEPAAGLLRAEFEDAARAHGAAADEVAAIERHIA